MIYEIDHKVPFHSHSHTHTINFQLSYYPKQKMQTNGFRSKQFPFQSLLENYRKVKCRTASTAYHNCQNSLNNISFLTKYINKKHSTRNISQSINSAKIQQEYGSLNRTISNSENPPIKFQSSPSKKCTTTELYRASTAIKPNRRIQTSQQKKRVNAMSFLKVNVESLEDSYESSFDKKKILDQLYEMNERHTKKENVQKDEANERMKALIVNIRNKIYEGSRLLKKIGAL